MTATQAKTHGQTTRPVTAPGPNDHADAWPLRSHLELGALPSAVPSARLHARLVVAEWGLAELAEVVELTVSEIATNAVQASAGLTGSRYQGRWQPGLPPVRLWLHSDRERVLVQVWDGSGQMPRRPELDPDAEHGRGLLLVESLSTEWGAYVPQGSTGKVVWATLDGRPHWQGPVARTTG